MPPVIRSDEADTTWWNDIVTPHLRDNWGAITERFDAVIVDEAQDFGPGWIELLTTLLDPAAERRIMLLADEAQTRSRCGTPTRKHSTSTAPMPLTHAPYPPSPP